MINYRGGAFGIQVLLRMHGSAVFKALLPSLISTIFFLGFFNYFLNDDDDTTSTNDTRELFDHPYPVAAFIGAFTFLLTFKASFSYNRYWEACTVVHQMHSKWLDVGIEMSAFHLQSNRFKHKPPAFGSYPQITCVVRERERNNKMTKADLEQKLEQQQQQQKENGINSGSSNHASRHVFFQRLKKGKNNRSRPPTNNTTGPWKSINAPPPRNVNPQRKKPIKLSKKFNPLYHLTKTSKMQKPSSNDIASNRGDAQIGDQNNKYRPSGLSSASTVSAMGVSQSVITSVPVEIEDRDDPTSSVFLQEAAHLLSLLSAVAMSTLRNDLEEAESPLTEYIPNSPWPSVDPDAHDDIKEEFIQESSTTRAVRYLLGMTRTPKSRTLYNAARPFRVIGGVSDAEIEALQTARGPLAKVALCSMWLQEFISREYMSGSTGNVAPPIISRLYQFLSDGMLGYNQARKVAYIPFPFPHAQITSLFVLVIVLLIPILMLCYVTNIVFGGLLNFFTVLCFTGLHEVSRELENPFRNVPNDIPLNNFQAQFNEALIVMYFGYHPDAWWQVEEKNIIPPLQTKQQQTSSSQAAQLRSLPSHVAVAAGNATSDSESEMREVSLLTTDQLSINGVDVDGGDEDDNGDSTTNEYGNNNSPSITNKNYAQSSSGASEEKEEKNEESSSSNSTGLPDIAE